MLAKAFGEGKEEGFTSSLYHWVTEHSYAVLDTPKTLKRKLDACTDSAATVKRKLKLSLERERRLRRKVSSFNEIIDDLKHKQLISEDASAMLERCFTGIPLEVTKRLLKQTSSEGDKSSVKLSRDKYSPALRAFALTLQFYSTKAYSYVRETFQCSLLHPSTITNGEPGFTSEAINAIRAKANEAKKNNKQLLCNLVADEMAIRKHLEWDGKKFRGYVDIGNEVDDDSNAVASEALFSCSYLWTPSGRDASGASVSWDYIVQLQELQEKEGLHAATKLRAAHIQWQKQKMKVNLAVQTLSTSVADAIDFCREDLQLPQFKNSEGTVKFIRMFDKLFDFLNSRNPVANGFKAPLRPSNKGTWMNFFEEVKEYIRGLTDGSGVSIFRTPRRTQFLKFLVTIESVIGLASALLLSDNAPLRYFLTYKLSQDHIELFFAAVRSKGGWNNNPTVSQFVAAYKRLVTHNQVKGG
ncbi:hypothetical protein MRX96_038322 [Rhipicephalus microplus]